MYASISPTGGMLQTRLTTRTMGFRSAPCEKGQSEVSGKRANQKSQRNYPASGKQYIKILRKIKAEIVCYQPRPGETITVHWCQHQSTTKPAIERYRVTRQSESERSTWFGKTWATIPRIALVPVVSRTQWDTLGWNQDWSGDSCLTDYIERCRCTEPKET